MAISAHDIQINNRNVHYYEDGLQHGRSILFLHGGVGDAETNWQTVIPDFAKEYHILAPDLPGFGKSDSLPANSSLADIIAWVMAFLESQGTEQIAIVGNSFGALIARLIATQYPQMIPVVILVNGGYVPAVPALAKTLMGLPVIGTLLTRYLAKLAVNEESLNEMIFQSDAITPELIASAKANVNGFAGLMQMTATKPIPTSDKPLVAVLIIWGIQDGTTTVAEGKKLQQALTGAKFVDIEDCGHLPHLEEYDIFEWQVKDFLAKNDPHKRNQIPGT